MGGEAIEEEEGGIRSRHRGGGDEKRRELGVVEPAGNGALDGGYDKGRHGGGAGGGGAALLLHHLHQPDDAGLARDLRATAASTSWVEQAVI